MKFAYKLKTLKINKMTNETQKIQPAATAAPAPTQAQQPQVFSIEKLRGQVISNITAMIENKMLTAPTNYKEEIFFAFQMMADLPDIDKCEVKNICNEMAKIFRKGLCVTKKHCAMMVIKSKNSPTGKSLSVRDQYQGKEFIAKRDCGVVRVTPILRYQTDKFSSKYENGILKIEHEPAFMDGDEIIGGYCIVEYDNGKIEPRYYTKSELDKRRKKSQEETVWENRVAVGKVESRFWREWDREMYEKTLINATLTRIIDTSPDTIKEDDEEDENDVRQTNRYVDIDITPQSDPMAQQKPTKTIETQTGEIIISESEQVNL